MPEKQLQPGDLATYHGVRSKVPIKILEVFPPDDYSRTTRVGFIVTASRFGWKRGTIDMVSTTYVTRRERR
jgi:hypothetical protein